MSISSALNISNSGLRAAQNELDVIANNIANAETEGFTRRTTTQTAIASDDRILGVRSGEIDRVINLQAQSLLRELAAANVGNDIRADFLSRLDQNFGEPGTATALDTVFNQALASLEALATTPDDFTAQSQAVSDLRVFTSQLNSLSASIQDLRAEADIALATTVAQANTALANIEEVNSRILAASGNQSDPVALLDERDRFIDELAQIVDIEVDQLPDNQVRIRTVDNITLFNGTAAQLEFEQATAVGPGTTLQNGALSTITVTNGPGFSVDLFSNNVSRGGALGAYQELRDVTLVQAQSQLDTFAAELSLAISNRTVEGTPVADGFAVDVTGASDGNAITVAFNDNAGIARTLTVVQVGDPSQIPLPQSFTANANDTVVGVDFTQPDAAFQIQTQLAGLLSGTGLTITQTGTSFEFTAPGAASVSAASASITNTAFTGEGAPFTLFQDGATGAPFTDSPSPGSSRTGFAQRIEVASEIIDNPTLLARSSTGNANAGDGTRVNFVLDQIRNDSRTISPLTGIGSASSPLQISVEDFVQTIIAQQGQNASDAQRDAEVANVAFINIQDRVQLESGVNIDQELARLIELEQAFQANARVLATVQELIDTLFASF